MLCCMRFLVLSSSGPALSSLLSWLDVGNVISLSLLQGGDNEVPANLPQPGSVWPEGYVI